MKKVVILLCTYNEKDNIEKFTKEVFSEEKNAPGWKYEVLIVDSHSKDGTFEIAQNLAKKDPRVHVIQVGPGLGTALIEGHKYSLANLHPDAMAQLDSDGQVKADVLPRMLKALDDGFTLAIGSRFVQGGYNELSPMRRLFSWGACLYSRIVTGPWDIQEVTNSARAFTPELFKKINLDRIPWQEKTFIIQPAFLHEAVEAGAKYKEVPLVFKNRDEGYSKNKVFNYTYDIITYGIEARLRKWGIDVPFFRWSRKSKTFIKFGMVGVTGTVVDFLFYSLFISRFGLLPGIAKLFSGECGVINNFTWNNFWTFRHRRTKTSVPVRFLIFNLVSAGGILMGSLIVSYLHSRYGNGEIPVLGLQVSFTTFYFLATLPPVMIWNFFVNHYVTWRHHEEQAASVL